jgi:hypothetical protein
VAQDRGVVQEVLAEAFLVDVTVVAHARILPDRPLRGGRADA